ncbi:hypothetical protein CCHL11_06746 [Colletotrichum chlorophyti]|uniref:Uncharacterized protein n=1 Tax=Colletotrichum chlorophyti TaxID=708187 RepID=A0A1Q8RZ37_9PEZI|nr:hypothetical protein CCHL11_06746 [Colletotrichum chlorophyti]
MAPSAAEKAKAKFQAIIDDPGRHESTYFRNRVLTTRTPSGGSELTNVVTRRESTSSQGSTNQQHHIRNKIKNWISRPAI